MKNLIGRFLISEEGTTSIEYALIGTFVAVALALSVPGVATIVGNMYNSIADSIPHF